MLSMLGKIFGRLHFELFCLSHKIGFGISCKVAKNVKACFLEKKKEEKYHEFTESAERVVTDKTGVSLFP